MEQAAGRGHDTMSKQRMIVRAMSDKIDALSAEIIKLKKQLPEGMQECTIVFEECEKGHGSLRGTNWVKHECQQCKIDRLIAEKENYKLGGGAMSDAMIAVGADELGDTLGSSITCPICGGEHPIEYGEEILKDGTKVPSKLLSYYKCGDKAYLAGIKGRAIARGI